MRVLPNIIFLLSWLISIPFYGQERTVGLFLNTEEAYNGFTLMGNNEITYLIDNCGEVVNSWESDYKTGHGMVLLQNGDLLRAGSLPGAFNAGGGGGVFELFDWNGNLKWSYQIADDQFHAHHDLVVLPNGHFLCSVWELKTEKEAQQAGRMYEGDVWSESIWEIPIGINPADPPVWKWSAWDHLVQDIDPDLPNYGIVSDHPGKIDINYIGEGQPSSGNWLHINALDYHPGLDQIVMSSRNLSEIYVIDHSTTTMEASGSAGGRYGQGGDILFRYGNPQVHGCGTRANQVLFGQHDIRWIMDFTSAGDAFSVFNNQWKNDLQSRVEVFRSPADREGYYPAPDTCPIIQDSLLWSYTHSTFYSDILSSAQYLENGHFLITEGRTGHVTEVNREGEIVWDYIFPVNRNGGPAIQGGQPRFTLLYQAHRYPWDYEGLSGQDLESQGPIEGSPLANDCMLFDEVVTNSPTQTPSGNVSVLGNPVSHELRLWNSLDQETAITMTVRDLHGRRVYRDTVHPEYNTYRVDHLSPGLYVITVSNGYKDLQRIKIVLVE